MPLAICRTALEGGLISSNPCIGVERPRLSCTVKWWSDPIKGRRSRSVPVADPLVPIIVDAMRGKDEHDYLFPGPRGGKINSKNLSRATGWHTFRDGIKSFPDGENRLRWHDLRHTAANVLFRAGLSAPDVQAVLGHSSLAVTQLYSDTRNDAAKRATTALSGFWATKSKSQSGGGDLAPKTPTDQGFCWWLRPASIR
ncbi:MAG TPA: tyrosine-type recombinase/integrase [Terrimesophilobacter sp.]|nr:tyrosine-type recombinase/integrase [Terrimesophilobacter sp.]HRQ00602.1 tyrosine-type recombinase/integrase [Terrimesophilobacter sp.]